MKKLTYLLILCVGLVSCENFLEEESQDMTTVESADQFQALMLEEFNNQYPLFGSVYHMTDDLEEITMAPRSRKPFKTTFTWQQEIEIDENGNTVSGINTSWQSMYEDIAIVNYVIEAVDQMQGTPEQKLIVKGEAYFIRAMSYFNLLNLYGQPFNEATKNTDLGVPLRTSTAIEVAYDRNTVAEGYAQVESDLINARENIELSGVTLSKWHPSVLACDLLMSRVKLYQEKWDEAIAFADAVINQGQLASLQPGSPFITEGNPELLYVWHKTYMNRIVPPSSFGIAGYKASDELVALYEAGDNRKSAFLTSFSQSGNIYYTNKKHSGGFEGTTSSSIYTTMGFQNLRIAEAYLNKAEAMARKGDINAIELVKQLHLARFSDTSTLVYPGGIDEILNYIYDERRREFCFEDHHRWFDLRRMLNAPEIVHYFTTVDEEEGEVLSSEKYTLESNDLNYTLPIPIKERENNPGIINNERIDKLPEVN